MKHWVLYIGIIVPLVCGVGHASAEEDSGNQPIVIKVEEDQTLETLEREDQAKPVIEETQEKKRTLFSIFKNFGGKKEEAQEETELDSQEEPEAVTNAIEEKQAVEEKVKKNRPFLFNWGEKKKPVASVKETEDESEEGEEAPSIFKRSLEKFSILKEDDETLPERLPGDSKQRDVPLPQRRPKHVVHREVVPVLKPEQEVVSEQSMVQEVAEKVEDKVKEAVEELKALEETVEKAVEAVEEEVIPEAVVISEEAEEAVEEQVEEVIEEILEEVFPDVDEVVNSEEVEEEVVIEEEASEEVEEDADDLEEEEEVDEQGLEVEEDADDLEEEEEVDEQGLEVEEPVAEEDELSDESQEVRMVFAEGKIQLTDEMRSNMRALVEEWEDSGLRWRIMSYASKVDNRVNSDRRVALQRAIAVRSYLIEAGISSLLVNVQALGEKSESPALNEVVVSLVP